MWQISIWRRKTLFATRTACLSLYWVYWTRPPLIGVMTVMTALIFEVEELPSLMKWVKTTQWHVKWFTHAKCHPKDSNQSPWCKNIEINKHARRKHRLPYLFRCRNVRLILNDACRGIAAMSLTKHHCSVDHRSKRLEITCVFCVPSSALGHQ